MVYFCDLCDRSMVRDTSDGVVVFRCECGARRAGGPSDARISGKTFNAEESVEKWDRLIFNAALDAKNARIKYDCGECGRDYCTMVRVGEAELVILKCKCGRVYNPSGGDAPVGEARPAAAPAAADGDGKA